ncbi:hypothetical protein PHIM7_114 [Sinorhizobium phage phiM7]|uniref:Uncharacterized protein n=3 Tax=Emdodecavirus TaxID=1980937 RepID=S5MPP9_9CAUD|nr:hypothetical protein AB690_gp129 [Sinorhizobium phage phiM12]YP_009212368.1 hypothetical protein AVT40_gp128 [Sinorhizobium phage phiN3]YP_009601239.1 hypothetical protein FDH46_gp114 [Sinorhizobium phage phiM7]AKF13021.1 hypothetical protein PHIM19_115 [Sinorhizobium phage phiM19]AGR47805.1 hypothetical protein SmphiM12_173 [Sinorhizobium phage phiM12]AKF12661.1 hypothetical protein PHIM7_114 [Sinorhizobium phage phiM7]AKF13393.1 hypothetical protein PHIN3_128 [Sinorhizobium phage phiN3]
MNSNDISTERWREYIYHGEDGLFFSYRIDNPSRLFVKKDQNGDSHRVVDIEGVTHYPKRGWVAIRWFAPDQPVSF